MSELLQDLRYGLRTLGQNPSFTAVAMLTLAIGIGANTAIFSFVDGVLLKPLPYAEPDRIMRVLEKPPGGGRNGISTLNYLDWQKENHVFEYMAAQSGGSVVLTGLNEPVHFAEQSSRPHYFRHLRDQAVLGRTFLPRGGTTGQEQCGCTQPRVMGIAFWIGPQPSGTNDYPRRASPRRS